MKSNFNYLTLLTLSIFLWSGCSEQKKKVADQSAIDTTDDNAQKSGIEI